MSSKMDQAEKLFAKGFNCAQAVACVFCETYNVTQDDMAKITTGLGGGMRSGEMCGAASAAVLVVGLKHGQAQLNDRKAKKACAVLVADFVQNFKTQHGACTCRDLLQCDISTPEGLQKAKPLFGTLCVRLVRQTVETLEKAGY